MRRAWHTWVAFGACMAVVLGAMAWITVAALRLDRAEAEARRQAAIEESVRLALWRMDSTVAPLIAEENARPYFEYSPFYPVERAYTRMFARIERGEVLMPSPLLTGEVPYVRIHFQLGPDGALSSPQVPTGNMRDLAEGGYTTPVRAAGSTERLGQLGAVLDPAALLEVLPRGERLASSAPVSMGPVVMRDRAQGQSPGVRSTAEGHLRASNVAQQLDLERTRRARSRLQASDVKEGLIRPMWLGSMLVLARRVRVADGEYVQGCWLDWAAIRRMLLETVEDLLPNAALVPAAATEMQGGPRRLAAIPVTVVPGEVPVDGIATTSPIRVSLMVAWGCVVLAAATVGGLLRGAVTLSERRAAFVSAVTHELRTPLTTFRMYTEMLAEGMVPDEAKRRSYLDTLQTEANRLGHLVENVLAYARLERGRAGGPLESVTARALLDRVGERLARHAAQAGMELLTEVSPDAAQHTIRADPAAVEQILFNLVDNACKYARSASDRRIHLHAETRGGSVLMSVRDHGPGIAPQEAGRIFRAFAKSARDAANSAPGVGLGLSLSRRLARQMGGDLSLEECVEEGACFALRLPGA